MSNLHSSLTAAIFMAATAAAQSNSAASPAVSFTRSYNFAPIGLTGTETLQVNVMNTPTTSGSTIATLGTPTTCTGSVSFSDANGKAIGSPMTFNLSSGQIFSAPLPFGKTGYSSRGEILATVQQTVQFTSAGQCSLSMSLETFDTNSGVTHAVLTSASPALPSLISIIEPGAGLTNVQ